MDNFQLALQAAQLVEALAPSVATGIMNIIQMAKDQGVTVEQLYTDALSKAQMVKDLSDKELNPNA